MNHRRRKNRRFTLRHTVLITQRVSLTSSTHPLTESTLAGRHRTQSLRPRRSLALAHLTRQLLTTSTRELANLTRTSTQNRTQSAMTNRRVLLPEPIQTVPGDPA